jgi:transcriptional regulator with XRE-family HTH domain
MSGDNLIGDFLRARRSQVRPEDVGLHVTGVRRVEGLRREEVALLAGVSNDYYLRLEQGRDRNPSVQVLEGLARVLQLDDDATDYLISLAAPRPKRRRRPRREVVPDGIRELLGTLNVPAFVEGRYFDVLAANPLATALSPTLRTGENRMRSVFLDPAEQALFARWEDATATLVAAFRESVGTDTDDPRFIELVGELSLGSDRFRHLWARHDVHLRAGVATEIDHPQVGRLTLRREKLVIGAVRDQILTVYHAQAGSPSAEKLSLLASIHEPSAPTGRRGRLAAGGS